MHCGIARPGFDVTVSGLARQVLYYFYSNTPGPDQHVGGSTFNECGGPGAAPGPPAASHGRGVRRNRQFGTWLTPGPARP
eukprot:485744-Hanusia_phi.AAC.1